MVPFTPDYDLSQLSLRPLSLTPIPIANLSLDPTSPLCPYGDGVRSSPIVIVLQSTMMTQVLPIRVLTHNIRYATTSPFKGEQPWAQRKQLLLNELQYEARHCQETFVCLQEVLYNQLGDLLAGLNQEAEPEAPEWDYIGVGRDDGHQSGEYSPIFYRPAIWELIQWETVWLSSTPDRPSKSWDAASIRIVTIGVFTHRQTQNTILVLNTHLDDQGSRSRLEAARIILRKIAEYRGRTYDHDGLTSSISGTVLAGDFNSEEKQEAYQELTTSLLDASKAVEGANDMVTTLLGLGLDTRMNRLRASTMFWWIPLSMQTGKLKLMDMQS